MQRRTDRTLLTIGLFLVCFLLAGVPSLLAQEPPQEKTQQPDPAPNPQTEPEKPVRTERELAEMNGDLHMARKRFSEAIEVYKSLLQKEPKNPVLLNKIGIAYHQLMQLGEARRYYQRSIKADKTYAPARNNLGAVYYDMRKYRQAVNEFRRAIKLRPDMATAHSGLGYSYFARKKYDDAVLSFQRALQLDPDIFERRSSFGSLVQSGTVADRALFYFFLAKTFALQDNAERCAHYLRKSRDEGYKNIDKVETDPAFASVLKDPLVQQVLHPTPTAAATPRPPGR